MYKRKDGRYAHDIYQSGIKKTLYASTQKELKQLIFETQKQIDKGIVINNDTFGHWRKRWEEDVNDDTKISYNVKASYKCSAKHLMCFDDKLLKELTADDIEQKLKQLAIENPNTHKPSSQKTLNQIRMVLGMIYKKAIRSRKIEFNLAEIVVVPRGVSKEIRQPLTSEQQKWIVETPHKAQTFAMICLFAGLRRSEVLALKWEDIDFVNRQISVYKVVEFQNNTPIIKNQTKSAAGTRGVPIPIKLFEYLYSIRQKSGYVISNNGRLLTKSQYKRMWESYISDLNIKYGSFEFEKNQKSLAFDDSGRPIKFQPHKIPVRIEQFTAHQLRHTYCTNLFYAGVEVNVAKELMGHSSINVTLDIYTHLQSSFKTQKITKLDKYLNNVC